MGVGADSPKARVDALFKQDLYKECNRPLTSGTHPVARPSSQVSECMGVADEMVLAVVAMG